MAQEKIHVPKRKWNPSFTQKLNPIHYWLMGSTFEMLSFIGSIYYPSCWQLKVKWHKKKSTYEEENRILHSNRNQIQYFNGPMGSTLEAFSYIGTIYKSNYWWLKVKWDMKICTHQQQNEILHPQINENQQLRGQLGFNIWRLLI